MTRREPYEWQEKDILGFLENDLTGLNASQPGAGKGHPLDEPILTPNGWVPVGDLQPGDEVVGSDGNPTRVLDVYDRGILPVYRVTFRDGASVRVDGDHLWRVYVSSGRTYVRSTESLTGLSSLGIYSIPTTQVTHPTAELPIDPYALGALIADGYLHGSGLTWTKNEVAVVDEMRLAVARSGGVLTDHKVFAARRYGVTGLSGTVNRLGLKVGSADKFIPAEYLTASVEQRLALVHGLFDGDGSVRSDRGTAHYTTISDRLADDVLQLLWSLGVFATKYRTNHPRGSYWVITVHGGFNPFGVSEQRNRVTGTTRPFKRSFKSIELESNEPVRCIRVEAADSLYITKDYIVTHNTLTTVEVAHRAGTDVNLIIAPDSTHATAWGPTVLGQTGQELRVVGNKNKATQSALFDLGFGHPGWYAVTPQFFTRTDISEWFPDLLIHDEHHQLSKPKSKGQRKLSGYAPKRDKPISKQVGAVMALSGTPFRNDFQRAWSVTRLLWPELSGFGQIADIQHDRWCRYRMNSEYDHFSHSKVKYTTERHPGQLFSEMPYVVQHLAREQCCAFHPTGFLSLEKPNEIVYEVPLLPSQVKVIKDLEKMSMAWLEDNPLIADLPIVMAGRIRQAVIGEMRIDNDGNVAYADNAKSPIIDTAIEIAHEHDGEPVVVFTASQKAAELATAKFIKAGFSAVEVSGDYRTTRVEDLAGFGTKYQIAVCVIAAVGTGTDGLQRHSNVEIWLDRDLDSTNNIQAESRLDRIGATKQVQRYILRDTLGFAEKRYTRETMIRTSIEQSTRRRT